MHIKTTSTIQHSAFVHINVFRMKFSLICYYYSYVTVTVWTVTDTVSLICLSHRNITSEQINVYIEKSTTDIC